MKNKRDYNCEFKRIKSLKIDFWYVVNVKFMVSIKMFIIQIILR